MDKQKRVIILASTAVCVMILLSLIVTSVSAQVYNSGFEELPFVGWGVNKPTGAMAEQVTTHTSDLGKVYRPVEGNYFALLKTADGSGSQTYLIQRFDILAGETICGHAAFDAQEFEGGDNDYAAVCILNSSMSLIATPWYSDVSMIGFDGDTPWTYWEWTAPASDMYVLEMLVTNAGDSLYDSYALFDGCKETEAPALTPTGLIALVGLLSAIAAVAIVRKRH